MLTDEICSQFRKISRLAIIECPKIFVTATLPPHLESSFKALTGLADDTPVIRDSTPQTCRYSSVEISRSLDLTKLAESIKKYCSPALIARNEKAIIFCTSIEDVEVMGRVFGGIISHAKQGSLSVEQRRKNENEWKTVDGITFIVASTTLIHGISELKATLALFIGENACL